MNGYHTGNLPLKRVSVRALKGYPTPPHFLLIGSIFAGTKYTHSK
jgi:hypothetical protein